MSERSSTPSADLAALTLSPARFDELPFDVLVNLLLACDTISICRLASTSKTIVHCCVAGRVWEAVWRRQFGDIWELEDEDHEDLPIPLPAEAALVAREGKRYKRQPSQQLNPRKAATRARSWLRKAATCRHHLIDAEKECRYQCMLGDDAILGPEDNAESWASSTAYRWMGLFDDRGHICTCSHCDRPFAVTVKTGFRDTDHFSSRMVLNASFRPIKEAPARDSFEVVWYSVEAQMAVKRAMRDATRWPDGVCEVDADGKSVHAKSGFSGGPASDAAPTAGTWANWPDAQN